MEKRSEGAAAFRWLLVAGSMSAVGRTPADDGKVYLAALQGWGDKRTRSGSVTVWITLVVPPEPVYDDKDRPPAIPSEATMIYTLRMLGVLPPDKDR